MRLAALALCLGLLFAGCSATEPAGEAPEEHWTQAPAATPIMKFGRGTANVAVSPADIPMTVVRRWGETEGVLGRTGAVVVGLGEGICNGLWRIGWGVTEILSFPLVNDKDPYYTRPLGESVFGSAETPEADT